MKNRDIRNILEILLLHFNTRFNHPGLCEYASSLADFRIISNDDKYLFYRFLRRNKPRTKEVKMGMIFFWPKYQREPRKKYLQRMIDKLDKEAAGITKSQRKDR